MQVAKSKVNRSRNTFVLISLMALSLCGCFFSPSLVWAYEGYGATGAAVDTKCETYPHAFSKWCGGDSGGVSWHIYSVNYPPNGGGPIYDTSLIFLRDGGYDNGLPDRCVNEGASYYIAFAFDGRESASGPYATYGPIRHPYTFPGGTVPEYNGYSAGTAHSYSEVQKAISEGVNVNAWRLSETAASEAYYEMTGSYSISEGKGYFCAGKQATLSGEAVDKNGKRLGNDPGSVTVTVGKSASIERKDINGYTFLYWRKSGSSDVSINTKKYTVNKMTEDVKVYAVYEKKPTAADFLGQSNVSLRSSAYPSGISDYAKSDINPIGIGMAKAEASNSRNICVGKNTKMNLTFSHSVFSSYDNKTATAKMTRNFSSTGNGYSMKNAGTSTQSANFDTNTYTVGGSGAFSKQNPVYFSLFRNNKRYSDGTYEYFHRDFAEVTFTKAGNYNFCETLQVKGVSVTQACANITVTDKDCGQPVPEDPIPKVPEGCGKWTPSSYTSSDGESGTTSVVSRVRNNDVPGTVSGLDDEGWGDYVYAKPQDSVEWIHCYYPGVQRAAFTQVTTNNYHPEPSRLSGNVNTLYRSAFSSFDTWENKYTIRTSASNRNRSSTFSTPKVRGSITNYSAIGNSDALSFDDDSYSSVALGREGDVLTESNTPGSPVEVDVDNEGIHTWDCNSYSCNPHDCGCDKDGKNCSTCWDTCYETCSHSTDFIASSRTACSASDVSSADVRVPYNFINTTNGVAQTNSRDYVFAGEEGTFSFNITTSPRQNGVTKGNYATMVPNASWWLDVRTLDKNGNVIESTKSSSAFRGTLNGGSNLSGDSVSKQITVNIPDAEAGAKFCVTSSVYPSGVDGDMDMVGSNGSTTSSSERCFTIAKRPSLQVWGGNIYANGLIKTSTANKKNLAHYAEFPYKVEGNSYGHFMYGSWVDSGIISNGGVSGFSSGASLGGLDFTSTHRFPNPFSPNNNEPLATEPGGSKEVSDCRRSPLTFANEPCSALGALNSGANIKGNIDADSSAIVSKFIYENGQIVTGGEVIDINSDNSKYLRDDGVYYFESSNGWEIGRNLIEKNSVHVFYNSNPSRNITIKGDEIYDGDYSTFDEMPKMVIYSKGDINIRCNVARIDALLIAEGNVNTCSDANDGGSTHPNGKNRAKQLVINGAVISKTMTAGRTYGAAAGANSIVPAEIISFDPSLHLWSAGKQAVTSGGGGGGASSDVDMKNSTGSLNITYQKEYSPRL